MSKQMTNYNERLDEILKTYAIAINSFEAKGWKGVTPESEAKQAITSLIKELVAEAKPFDYVPKGHEPYACLNHEKYTSACCSCHQQRARVYAIDQFEQNLLKALEEL